MLLKLIDVCPESMYVSIYSLCLEATQHPDLCSYNVTCFEVVLASTYP